MFNILSGAQASQIDSTLIAGVLAFVGVLIVALANSAWSYYLFRQQQKDAAEQRKETAENTVKLNEIQTEIVRKNRLHTQRVQTLTTARETLTEAHKAYDFLATALRVGQNKNPELLLEKRSQVASGHALLGGIAEAIGDPELMDKIYSDETFSVNNKDDTMTMDRINKSARKVVEIHIILTKLIEDSSKI